MNFAVMQKAPEPPTAEQLKAAYQGVPGVPAVDAARLAANASGILARGLRADQASAFQAGLAAQGIAAEVIEESALPPLPPGKVVRRVEITPEALMIHDPLGRTFPVAWSHVLLIAAGSVQQASFQRKRTEKEVVRTKFVQGFIPIQVKEVKVDFTSQESAAKVLRGEIVLTRGVARYTIEAEDFNYACLGARARRETAADFGLLLGDLVGHAPQAVLSRGAATLLAGGSGKPAVYPNQNAWHSEILWEMWRMK